LVVPIIAYTLSSTKMRYKGQNSFCWVVRGWGEDGGGWWVREGMGERGRIDPNIVCTYE
jgi:hypothetical protein